MRRKKRRLGEYTIEKILFAAAGVSVFITLAILGVLLFQAIGFFGEVSIVDFFTGTQWTPLFKDQQFGILPLISGTLLVTAIAIGVAVPIGLGKAVGRAIFRSLSHAKRARCRCFRHIWNVNVQRFERPEM